ncbi:MAG: hypothetical protein JXA01_09015 [Dehalococcoidia bacterium]|nr:hypothetical protein [Dehalococcoidia bacterium]
MLGIAVLILAGCASAPSSPVSSPAQEMSQPALNQPDEQSGRSAPQQNSALGNGSSDNISSSGGNTSAEEVNRIDVVYFHVNQRCVTCLCFEEHINSVIEKYFTNAIESEKLTYRVLNAQIPQNAEIAGKYGAVGSQLFINTITGGEDHIEDIANIWYWNCRNNPKAFELKVRSVIEQQLKVLD